MVPIEPSVIPSQIHRRSDPGSRGPAYLGTVCAAARPGAEWLATANADAGFLVLARGRGPTEALADYLPDVVEAALRGLAPGGADPAGGPPPPVRSVVSFLQAVHRDVRRDPLPAGQGLAALVAIAGAGRVHIITAGGVACLRWRDGEIDLVAPLSQRARPGLGESERALIEVTSEPFRPRDLIVAIPGGFELMANATLPPEVRRAITEIGQWVEARGELPPAGWESPCAILYLAPEGAAGEAAAREPAARADSHQPGSEELDATNGFSEARVEIRPPGGDSASLAMEEASPDAEAAAGPEDGLELPDWLAATGPDGGAGPAGERRDQRRFPWPRVVGLIVAAIGMFLLVVTVSQMVRDRERPRSGEPEAARKPPAPIRAQVAVGGGPSGAAALAPTPPAPAAAPRRGAISARTEPLAPGISVFVDDRPAGESPVTLDSVGLGRHRVRFSGADGFSWEEEVQVRAGETSEAVAPIGTVENVTLVSIQTTVMSDRGVEFRDGLPVVIDGRDVGETPFDIELDPGVHEITIRRASGPPIHRVLDVRRGDRLNLDIRLDRVPAVTIEHTPPSQLTAGETPVLTALRRGLDAHSADPIHLHYAIAGAWQDLVMAPVPGAAGTHAVGLPLGDASGQTVRYYFSTTADGDETVYSRIYSVRLR